MKTRIVPESNYKSFWLDSGKTIRIAIDPNKPITELEYPEFYDIKLTSKCNAKCPWCYQDSKTSDENTKDVVKKLRNFFNSIPSTDLPYQIAYGGGEPTESPEFNDVLKMTKEEFDISPNFTTNGMWAEKDSDFINKHLEVVKKYCGGVAISCHPHLEEYWDTAARLYIKHGVRLNFHNIISDKESIDGFLDIFHKWKYYIEYFVLLPYGNVGRGKNNPKQLDWDYFVSKFPMEDRGKIAFGANFYPYLLSGDLNLEISLYEPEILSKYIDLKDNGYLYPSSFSDKILKENFLRVGYEPRIEQKQEDSRKKIEDSESVVPYQDHTQVAPFDRMWWCPNCETEVGNGCHRGKKRCHECGKLLLWHKTDVSEY